MKLGAGVGRVFFVCLAVLAGWTELATAQTLTLTWEPSPDPSVIGYIVYTGTQSGQYSAEFNVGLATSFVYDVVPDQSYFFAVAAYADGPLVGPVSSEVVAAAHATVLLPNPGDQLGTAGSLTELQPPNDVTPPVVTITLPGRVDRVLTVGPLISIGGVSADDNEVVAVTWTNSRGGSGAASGTDVWLAGVALYLGRNDITITGVDQAGNRGTATISIYRQTSSP